MLTTTILLALLGSFLFVFAILGLGIVLFRTGVVDNFTSRKIIHIGVSHWWFFQLFLIKDPWWGLVGPLFFVAFNILARRITLLKAMEPPQNESNLGTIYFPLSLIVMVVWSGWGGMPLWVAGAGILVLGWGDGLAALVGKFHGSTKLPLPWSNKTWKGTFALVFASTVVLFSFMICNISVGTGGGDFAFYGVLLVKAFAIAIVLAVIEALTPFGLDNLVLPAAASSLLWVLI